MASRTRGRDITSWSHGQSQFDQLTFMYQLSEAYTDGDYGDDTDDGADDGADDNSDVKTV